MLVLPALFSACDTGTGPGGSAIQIVHATLRDTIGAIHRLDLVVRDHPGRLTGRTQVLFQTDFSRAPILVKSVDDSVFRPWVVDTADLLGRVSVRTQHGFTAGQGALVVSVPVLGSVDTVWFTVDPGNLAGVRVAPADTALYTGREFALYPYTVDRYRNRRAADTSFQFFRISGPVTVTATGTVTTTELGRATLVVRAAGFTDTAYVSVVPQGWVATQKFYAGNGGPEGIFLVQLDGSGRDSLTPGLDNSFVPHGFGWSPDGQQIVLTRLNTLYLLQPGGTEQPFVTMTAGLNTAARFSRDGQWVYFALAYSSATQRSGLYRVRRDGTGVEHIGDDTSHFGVDYFASPSHDGQSVVYTSSRTPCGVDTCIRVLDLATNRDRVYGSGAQDYLARGAMAVWSAAEDLIAYSSGQELRLVRSDGTPVSLVASDAGHVKWMDWSPDGNWLIVAADFGVVLFGVHDGLRLPLAPFLSYGATAWRP